MKKEVIFTKNDLKEFIEECKELCAGESNQWYGYAIENVIENHKIYDFQERKTKLNTQGGPPWK